MRFVYLCCKSDLKVASGANRLKCSKKGNLAELKSNFGKKDIHKKKTVHIV